MTTANSTSLNKEEDRFHPSYSSDDADLVLISKDGVKFRVHSSVLNIASNVFRDMLQSAIKTEEPIYMDDESSDLEMIFNAIYPDGNFLDVTIKSFQTLWQVLNTADKYNIRKVHNVLKKFIEFEPYLKMYPLECYALACRCNWEELIQEASTATLAVDLRLAKSKEIMKYLDANHLLQLYSLHEKRRTLMADAMKMKIKYIDSRNPRNEDRDRMAILVDRRSTDLQRIYQDFQDQSKLAAIKYFLLSEMEKCSDGSTLFTADFWGIFSGELNQSGRDQIQSDIQRIFGLLPRKVGDVA